MTAINTSDAYWDSQVLSADPIELVALLYRGALDSIQAARTHLRNRDIESRSRMISKAVEIVSELALSVDLNKGGNLARNLVELYDYMQRRLLEANARQSESGLVEVDRLLRTLLEAWQRCGEAGRERAAKIELPQHPKLAQQPEAVPDPGGYGRGARGAAPPSRTDSYAGCNLSLDF